MTLLAFIPHRDYKKKTEKRTQLRIQNIFSIPHRDYTQAVNVTNNCLWVNPRMIEQECQPLNGLCTVIVEVCYPQGMGNLPP